METTSTGGAGRGWVPSAPGERAAGPAGADGGAAAGRGRHRAEPVAPLLPPALVPSTVRGGRWRPSPAGAAGVVGVLVVLAVALALRAGALDLVGDAPVPERAALAGATAAAPVRTGAAPASASPAPTPETATGGEVVVHVVGEVARPGLVRVPAGARVADALEQAGGAGPLADLTRVNLARPVVDGEQVLLPRQGEAAPVAAPPAGTPPGAGAGAAAGAPVDLNQATLEQLDALDGIGPVLAQRILDWRTTHGRFSGVDELGEVDGIGDKLLERLRAQVTV